MKRINSLRGWSLKTRSAKNKGSRLQKMVAKELRQIYHLPDEDVKSAIMGENGVDIKLSFDAKQKIPFDFECKNVERISIWKAIEQAKDNAEEGRIPTVVMKRNNWEPYVVISWKHFKELL
jgi:hypothetical protein